MWSFLAVSILLLFLHSLLFAASFLCWLPSKRVGFLFFAAAFLFAMVAQLPYVLVVILSRPGGRLFRAFFNIYPIVNAAAYVAFTILMLLGLLLFYRDISSHHGIKPPPSLSDLWRFARRAFFCVMGVVLFLTGPPLVLAVNSLSGVGLVAMGIGVMCLWLGLHRGSPLVQKAPEVGGQQKP